MAQQAALADELSALNERGGSYEAELSAKRKAQSGLLRQRMQLEKEQKRLQQKQQKKVCCPRRVASSVGGVAVLMPPFMPSFLRSSPKAEGHGSGVRVSSACLRLVPLLPHHQPHCCLPHVCCRTQPRPGCVRRPLA